MSGLGILVGLVAVMLGSDVNTQVVTIIVLAYLAAVFGICFSLVRQVPKLIDARLKASGYGPQDVRPAEHEHSIRCRLRNNKFSYCFGLDHIALFSA